MIDAKVPPISSDTPKQTGFHPGPKLFLLVSAFAVLCSFLDSLTTWRKQGAVAFRYLFLESPLFDLYCYRSLVPKLHTPAFFSPDEFPWTYPAPCLWIYQFLYHGQTREGIWLLYLTSILLLVTSAAALFVNQLIRAGAPKLKAIGFVFCVVLLSWPIYFSVERGNVESFLWLGLAVALIFYIQKRYHLAAIGIGIIAAFKIYPILFLALFLTREKLRPFLLGVLAALLTTLLALYHMSHHVLRSAAFVRSGIRLFLSRYSATYDPGAIGFDHSAWSIFKRVLTPPGLENPHDLGIYTVVAAIAALVLFFTRVRLAPRKNQVLAICILTILLPSTSFDYTLQALYLPFAWIVVDSVQLQKRRVNQRGLTPVMICFALLLAPLTFVHGEGLFYGGQVKAVTLICLLVLAVTFPMSEAAPC